MRKITFYQRFARIENYVKLIIKNVERKNCARHVDQA